jgi:hypothetical protein
MRRPPEEPDAPAGDSVDDPYHVSGGDSGFPEYARVKPQKRREQSTLMVVATVVIAVVVGVIVFCLTFFVTCLGVLAAGNTYGGTAAGGLLSVALVLPFLTGLAAAGLAGFLVVGISRLFRR